MTSSARQRKTAEYNASQFVNRPSLASSNMILLANPLLGWRHLVDFPERSIRHSRNVREHDLGSGASGGSIEEEYPSLADITVEGVPAVRSLITDLALDILLYQSPTYKEHIARVVLDECNRIYALFKKRNPGFRGKVSLVGHSLGR